MHVPKKEQRRHHRIPFAGRMRISWEDTRGVARYAMAKCLDVSEDGIRIEVLEPIPARTRVSVQAEQIKCAGSATVKHVEQNRTKYILGLELSEALRVQTLSAIREP